MTRDQFYKYLFLNIELEIDELKFIYDDGKVAVFNIDGKKEMEWNANKIYFIYRKRINQFNKPSIKVKNPLFGRTRVDKDFKGVFNEKS